MQQASVGSVLLSFMVMSKLQIMANLAAWGWDTSRSATMVDGRGSTKDKQRCRFTRHGQIGGSRCCGMDGVGREI